MLAYHIIRAPAEYRSRDLPVPRRALYHWATDLLNKVKIWQKSVSPPFWPGPPPGACDVSEVWGTHRWTYSPSLVTVWDYHHPNFKYCTLFVSGTELRTDRRTDDPITRYPQRTFQAGVIKNITIKQFFWQLGDTHVHTLGSQGVNLRNVQQYLNNIL